MSAKALEQNGNVGGGTMKANDTTESMKERGWGTASQVSLRSISLQVYGHYKGAEGGYQHTGQSHQHPSLEARTQFPSKTRSSLSLNTHNGRYEEQTRVIVEPDSTYLLTSAMLITKPHYVTLLSLGPRHVNPRSGSGAMKSCPMTR